MRYALVVVWLVQAYLGLTLLRAGSGQRAASDPQSSGQRAAHPPRAGRRMPRLVIAHISLVGAALAAWVVFLIWDAVAWGWVCFGLLTIGLTFGDMMLTRRSVRSNSPGQPGNPYLRAIREVFTGRMPPRVIAHALVSPVVYFGVLAVCIAAS